MEAPLVSIIVPTYNRTGLLKQTLDSLLAQTFQGFEILVVDDGSEGTENEILCTTFPKLLYRKIENNGGPATPRNTGMRMAKGKYLAFVDDDDLWLPEKLEKQVKILEEHPEFGLVHTPCRVMDYNGIETGVIIGKPGTPDVKHGDVRMKMTGNWTLMMPTVLIRKEVLDTVGYFNEEMPQAGEDVEFWTRCSFYTKFYYLGEALALYRKHQSNSQLLKAKYRELPKYLKQVLNDVLDKKIIDKKQYRILSNNLVRKQIKESGGIKNVFWKLFALHPFWMFNGITLKLILKKLLV